ncbi:MAG TPA: 2-amino-4-hydroxy-6-hydroxymethyldihydropteridine diphosphokinase [Pirellulales bacterium]|jgi:2-amino-4-hydroxy-6-hydroxymethyldihydropteridine diphosphokinase
MSHCLIALGANLGDRAETMSRAVALLGQNSHFHSLTHSAWRETTPIGGPAGQPPYLNGALIVSTALPPAQVLAELQAIELRLGRDRQVRWGSRTIDLDLLLYDDLILSTPELTLPHPGMAFRKFVIEPAAEIAPEMRHPQIGWTLGELREHLLNAIPYVAITGAAAVGKSLLASQIVASCDARRIVDPAESLLRPAAGGVSGPSRPRQIEWLRRREPLVRRATWTDPARLAVSDFWLEQSLAYADAELEAETVQDCAEEQDELQSAWLQACRESVSPKLLVLLDPPSHSAVAAQRELILRSDQPGLGPVLRLTSADSQANFAEAAAAIAAMG